MSRRAAGVCRSTALAAAVLVAGVATCCSSLPSSSPEGRFAARRRAMVVQQIERRGLRDRRILGAMEAVPRHLFVPEGERDRAYEDRPLPIGYGQTISQPYVVALMTSLLHLRAGDRVLEIGTGSGYHAAVVSRLVSEVYTMEIIAPLGRAAARTLATLGYGNVHVRIGDGYGGWPEEAPFDAIVLTAAPPEIPPPLVSQLKVGGRLVAPVGGAVQELQVLTRTPDGVRTENVTPVRFVPMTGEAQNNPPRRR